MGSSVTRKMASMVAVAALMVSGNLASAQTFTPPLSVEAVGPTEFTIEPGRTLQVPFRLRVIGADGAPVSGIPVMFIVNTNPCFTGMCPPLGTYGYFLLPPPEIIAELVTVATDNDGVATAPTFRTTDHLVSVSGGIGWDYEVAGHPFVEYQITAGVGPGQGAGTVPSVLPVDSHFALLVLSLFLVAAAGLRLRRRKANSR